MQTKADWTNLCHSAAYKVTRSRKSEWREQSQPVISLAWSWMRRFRSSFSVFSNVFCSFSSDTSYREKKIFDSERRSSLISSSSSNYILVVRVQILNFLLRELNQWTKLWHLHFPNNVLNMSHCRFPCMFCTLFLIRCQNCLAPLHCATIFFSKVPKM